MTKTEILQILKEDKSFIQKKVDIVYKYRNSNEIILNRIKERVIYD